MFGSTPPPHPHTGSGGRKDKKGMTKNTQRTFMKWEMKADVMDLGQSSRAGIRQPEIDLLS